MSLSAATQAAIRKDAGPNCCDNCLDACQAIQHPETAGPVAAEADKKVVDALNLPGWLGIALKIIIALLGGIGPLVEKLQPKKPVADVECERSDSQPEAQKR